jgi:hypothetical protein
MNCGEAVVKKKKFDVAKHVKRLSRAALKTPLSKVVQSKKRHLLRKIEERETRERG